MPPAPASSPPPAGAPRWPVPLALGLVLAGAIALRLWVLTDRVGRLNADEAVTGVMAQRILGGEWFAFYPPQPYMGSLEQYLQAGVLAVAPDTPTTLRLVQVALSAVTCWLTFLLARRCTGSGWAGVLAAALFAIGPAHSVIWGTRSLGAYLAAQAVGVAGALIALRLRREDPRAGWWAGGLGLCLGLGVWLNPVAFFLLIPAALWALASGRGRLRALIPWAAGGAVLGALPFLVHHIPRGFEGITGYRQPPSSVADRLGGLWDPVLGMFLGARHIGTGAPVGAEWLAVLLGVLALAGLAAALWVRRRGLLDLVLLRAGRRAPVDVVLVALVLALAGYVASSYGWYTGEPRYLQSVYPALAVALAWAVHACGRWAVPVAAAALTAWAALTVAGIDAYRDSGGGGGFAEGVLVRPEDLPAVADALVARGVRTAYADYWLAYPLQFAAGDGLRVAATTYIRFPEDNRAAEDDPAAAVVVPTGPPADRVQALLGARGATFRRADVRGIAIFTRITPRTPPRALGLSPPWSFGVGG